MVKHRNVLITGGLGFLGSNLCRELAVADYKLTGIGHGCEKNAKSIGYSRWVDSDLNLTALESLEEKFDVIIHCAGKVSGSESLLNPHSDYRSNVQTTAELIEFVRRKNRHALTIYASSAAVYGSADHFPTTTDQPLKPITPYGSHKKVSEELMRTANLCFGLRFSIIRFFSIYGPGLRRQLLWDALEKITSSDEVANFSGTGQEIRDWIFIDDAVQLIKKVMNTEQQGFQIFNGASGIPITNSEILSKLMRISGWRKAVNFDGIARSGDPIKFLGNINGQGINWHTETTLEIGIERVVEWYVNEKQKTK